MHKDYQNSLESFVYLLSAFNIYVYICMYVYVFICIYMYVGHFVGQFLVRSWSLSTKCSAVCVDRRRSK